MALSGSTIGPNSFAWKPEDMRAAAYSRVLGPGFPASQFKFASIGSGLSINIAASPIGGWVEGFNGISTSAPAGQSGYHVYNTNTENIPLANAPHATQYRWDTFYLVVDDATYGSPVTQGYKWKQFAGTPAASEGAAAKPSDAAITAANGNFAWFRMFDVLVRPAASALLSGDVVRRARDWGAPVRHERYDISSGSPIKLTIEDVWVFPSNAPAVLFRVPRSQRVTIRSSCWASNWNGFRARAQVDQRVHSFTATGVDDHGTTAQQLTGTVGGALFNASASGGGASSTSDQTGSTASAFTSIESIRYYDLSAQTPGTLLYAQTGFFVDALAVDDNGFAFPDITVTPIW